VFVLNSKWLCEVIERVELCAVRSLLLFFFLPVFAAIGGAVAKRIFRVVLGDAMRRALFVIAGSLSLLGVGVLMTMALSTWVVEPFVRGER
jgi:hypothetical protein